MNEILEQFLHGLRTTGWLEYTAALSGIASVWFSRKESVLTYPIGLINTSFYVYISLNAHLLGEASVNFYYTIMSFYGWYMWLKKNKKQERVLHITYSDRKMWLYQLAFFIFFYLSIFFSLTYLKRSFSESIPWADAFASASAFTGMWLMTRKKVESWYWWIITNAASIPLYFVKSLMVTSVYYMILLVFAFWGLAAWKKKADANR